MVNKIRFYKIITIVHLLRNQSLSNYNLAQFVSESRLVISHLMGGPQVSLMVCVVTPSPRRFRGTSSGFTLTATLWLRRPRELSLVLAATATEY